MTEKRFTDDGFEAIEEQSFTDNQTGKTYYVDYFDEIVDLLNTLSEENEQLKSKNRGLQSELQIFKEDIKHSNIIINKLNDENEQLKKELKSYYNAFDCSQCIHHNYDWFDDCDEFEVCDKGNNEAQMNNHSCKDWEEL